MNKFLLKQQNTIYLFINIYVTKITTTTNRTYIAFFYIQNICVLIFGSDVQRIEISLRLLSWKHYVKLNYKKNKQFVELMQCMKE